MRSPLRRILVYTHTHRDRDCWPIASALRDLGHSVYYALHDQPTPAQLARLCHEAAFDLVLTSDRLLRSDIDDRYFLELSYRPRIYELIFNGLLEICEYYGRRDVDRRLEQQNAALLVMDAGLQSTLRAIGIERASYLRYCIPERTILDPAYYATRAGLRQYGWISPREHSAVRSAAEHALARVELRRRGLFARPKTFDVLFLGECAYGFDAKQIHDLSVTYLDAFDESALLAVCHAFERDFPALVELDIAAAFAARDRLTRPLSLGQPGLALFEDYLIVQFRRYRRLQMLRSLAAQLGPRLVLFGDQLAQLGLPARKTDHRHTDRHYLRAKIAIDFGSNIYDSTLYTRPAQIIASHACLLQLAQPDCDLVLGRDREATTFATRAELFDRVDAGLADDAGRDELMHAQRRLAFTTADWHRELTRTLLAGFDDD
ncbi:MAG TPA: hypothetical protein VIA18_11270 [Polyangia bacterium]|nr:hypothetical protein [Polyangia bacterium]